MSSRRAWPTIGTTHLIAQAHDAPALRAMTVRRLIDARPGSRRSDAAQATNGGLAQDAVTNASNNFILAIAPTS